jgi:MoxR-like ATPase
VNEEVGGGPDAVLGRQPELATVRRCVATDSRERALVLSGGAGIGKTTLWEAGIEAA